MTPRPVAPHVRFVVVPRETGTTRRTAMGLPIAVALVTGNIVGAGIWLLPASLGKYGAISLGGWVVTGLGSVLLALVFAGLARRTPAAGGPYAYVRKAFGDMPGFLTVWGYWIQDWVSNAALAVSLVAYAGVLAHPLVRQDTTFRIVRVAVALAGVWAVAAVNVAGVRTGGVFALVTTIAKVVPLAAVSIGGLVALDPGNLTPLNPSHTSDFHAVTAAAALSLFSFIGLESATVPADHVRDPERTIPRATMIGTVGAAVIYVLITLAVIGTLGSFRASHAGAPISEAADLIFATWVGKLVAVGAVVSVIGALSGWTLLCGQIPLAAAREGMFPARFGRTDRNGTPVFGIVVSSVLTSGLLLLQAHKGIEAAFTAVVNLTTFVIALVYLASSAARIRLRRHGDGGDVRRLWRDLVVAGGAGMYSVWVALGSGRSAILLGILLMAAGVPVYYRLRRRQPPPPPPR